MRSRSLTCGGLLLLMATSVAAQHKTPIPAGLKSAKPHEIIERVLNKKAELTLTGGQIALLTTWHETVADEPHRFRHDPSKKTHDVTHVPMIGRQAAFDSTVALLTPAQRDRLAVVFGTIPPGLANLKPHEIVEQVLNRKADLSLSDEQVARLTAWHERVADEPHRFKHDPTRRTHDVTHVPMLRRQAAFDSTVAILTLGQREQLASLFARQP